MTEINISETLNYIDTRETAAFGGVSVKRKKIYIFRRLGPPKFRVPSAAVKKNRAPMVPHISGASGTPSGPKTSAGPGP